MNKYEEFIDLFDRLVREYGEELSSSVKEVKEELVALGQNLKNKPLFTEAGLQILEYLQNSENVKMRASDIAQGMGVSSRKVSGAIRKLVSDSYVDKFGANPVMYMLTEKGKNFNLNEYKENMKNET